MLHFLGIHPKHGPVIVSILEESLQILEGEVMAVVIRSQQVPMLPSVVTRLG